MLPTVCGESPRRVLLVDDDVHSARLLGHLLWSHGTEVRYATGPVEAAAVFDEFEPDTVFSAVYVGGTRGAELLRRLSLRGRDFVGVLMTSGLERPGDPELEDYPILTRPWNLAKLARYLFILADATEQHDFAEFLDGSVD